MFGLPIHKGHLLAIQSSEADDPLKIREWSNITQLLSNEAGDQPQLYHHLLPNFELLPHPHLQRCRRRPAKERVVGVAGEALDVEGGRLWDKNWARKTSQTEVPPNPSSAGKAVGLHCVEVLAEAWHGCQSSHHPERPAFSDLWTTHWRPVPESRESICTFLSKGKRSQQRKRRWKKTVMRKGPRTAKLNKRIWNEEGHQKNEAHTVFQGILSSKSWGMKKPAGV